MIKICGLTRLEDVLLARDLGAWAVGFVFAPSPRRVTPGAARRLLNEAVLERGLPLTIGVFTDATADEIAWVVEEVGLDGVQLHGLLGPGGNAVRRALGDWERSLFVIQAVPVDPERAAGGEIKEAVAEACEEADAALLDTSARGRFGGTGIAFPWHLACEASEGTPVLVAGGINPDTVAAALEQSGAWGVDVSSGIEQAPGIKDPGLMRRLFAEAGVKPRTVPDGRDSVFRQPPSDRGAADNRDERQEGPDK